MATLAPHSDGRSDRTRPTAPTPRAPGGVPGLGHVVPLLRDPLGFMESLSRVGGVVETRLGPRRVRVVTAPALVHELLVALAHDAPRGAVQQTLKDAFGDGLLMSDGQAHRDRRRSMGAAFTKARVADYVPIIQSVVKERIAGWGDGRLVDVEREMNHLALDVVTRTLFGARLDDDLAAAFHRALPDLVKGQIVHSLAPHPAFVRLPLPVNRRFDEAVRVIHQVVDRAVGERREGLGEGVREGAREGEDDGREPTLLSLLRAAVDPATGAPLTEDDVRAEAITMFGAGTETVSTTMTWLLHELARHPDVLARVVAELDGRLGPVAGAASDALTPEMFDHLPYTANTLREVVRLHTPNAFLMRTASRDVTLGPYRVPAGTELLFSLTALHRHPDFFPDPHTFDPGRWDAEGPAGAAARRAAMPFGAGKHKCVGENLAWAELGVAAATILRTLRLVPVPGREAREVVWTTVQAQGLAMAFAPRTDADAAVDL
ncbi:cytochrome P450 [Streptomyces sp. NRRL F-5126]|uniref:cytochrome P450 n=1 Tax=Streptomyces sp. NRRL F-5126 TaxID=1463857 RepID=UPI00131EA8BE|nr:cytochrome P450 [Streptomyces sp. NRRL F-5126]